MQEKHDTSTFAQIRLARIGRIMLFCATAWSGFGFYYLLNGRQLAGWHCLCEGALGVVLAILARTKPDRRKQIATFYVGSVIAGLTFDSMVNGMQHAFAPIFFCCSVLIASLTLGKQHKWKIALCVFASIIANHYIFPLLVPAQSSPPMLDRVLALMTLFGVVAACSYYAESTSEAFAQQLEETTRQLRERTMDLDAIVGFDSLTSLRNRRRFREDSATFLTPGGEACLMLIDVNDFKLINDRLGHAAGDDVLRQVSSSLQSAVDDGTDIYRLGGDEFVVVTRRKSSDSHANYRQTRDNCAKRLVQSIRPHVNGLSNFNLGISVGVAYYPEHAQSLDELLSCADKAMYRAKAEHDSVVVFEKNMAEEAETQRRLKQQLTRAIEQNEFVLHYQPQIDIATNQIVGVEALLRWEKDGELTDPDDFVSCLEESGKIFDVGEWAIQTACEQNSRWRELGYEIRISVNVSSLQIQASSFADRVLDLLKQFDLPSHMLDLEITESHLLEHAEHANHNIETLTNHGVSFSIDDFGTGYSSLAYLKQLPVDRLKIDKSFIQDIPSSDDGLIAQTVITLARHLEMSVVAEGVETAEQLEFLRKLDCDEYQGFLFSHPLTADECTRLLRQTAMPGARSQTRG